MIRDTLKDQIEQIGKNIKRIVTKYIELPLDEERAEAFKEANKHLKEDIDIDLDSIFTMNQVELVGYFSERKFTDKHVEMLADLIHHHAQRNQDLEPQQARNWYLKEIELLVVADEITQSFSLPRKNRRDFILQLISSDRNT